MKKINNLKQLEAIIASNLTKAITQISIQLENQLIDFIQKNYDKNTTLVFEREIRLFLEPVVIEVLSGGIPEIFVDYDGLHCITASHGHNILSWDGIGVTRPIDLDGDVEAELSMWCHDNMINIINQELVKQGLTIK